MRISRDALFLIIMLIIFGIGSYYIVLRSSPTEDTPSSYATGKRGTKALYLLLQDMGFRVGRHSRSLRSLPADARILFVVDPQYLPDQESKALVKWVKKGKILILAVSSPIVVPPGLEMEVDWRPLPTPVSVRPVPGKYSQGVNRVRLEGRMALFPTRSTASIARDNEGIVIAEHRVGNGRVIFIGDPLFLANSNIREEDNVVLVTNFVYENAGKDDLVLFSEYSSDLPQGRKLPPVLGRGGKLAFAELGFVALLVLISAGRRFGAVHPLPEREERRKGWELVRAMAGLYRRAEAREVALTSIYKSFRRELFTRFGASPTARPDEVAETVLRARQVDRARLTALLARCEQIAGGRKTSDGEAIMLAKSIEEFRKELGIARSTDD